MWRKLWRCYELRTRCSPTIQMHPSTSETFAVILALDHSLFVIFPGKTHSPFVISSGNSRREVLSSVARVYLFVTDSIGEILNLSAKSQIFRQKDLNFYAKSQMISNHVYLTNMVRTAWRYLRRTHARSMHSTIGVCVCCLASNGTNLYRMMMYGG